MNQSQGLIQSPSGTTATAPGHQTGGLWYTPTYCNEGAEAAAGPEPEPFEVESGTRQASCGTTHNYDLVSPSPTAETARRPVVVLLHDWGRSSFEHRGAAETLARLGLAVLLPELGRRNDDASHATSVAALVDHCRWLRARAASAEDRIHGSCDASRVVLIGHGTGAAVVLDAASELQSCAQESTLPSVEGVLLLGPRPSHVIRPARLQPPRLFCVMQTLNGNATPGRALGAPLPADQLVAGLSFDATVITVLGAAASHETWESGPRPVHATGDLLRTIFPSSTAVDNALQAADDGTSPFGSCEAPMHKMVVQSLLAAFAADLCGLDAVPFADVVKYYVDKDRIAAR
jgi:pimeloyl-ACP methyl ester carboxylesterase